MTKTKSTKRALLMSGLALLMCVSMLIGSTFAWFTDSVTSAGNTIQSGTLKVDLVDAAGNSLEGKVIKFVDQDKNSLWEPGCTYKLEEVFVKNKGTLALKYEIAINGITGDAKLLEAIDWTVTVDGVETALADLKGYLLAGETSKGIVLKGHMKESAGNEYQGLTVEGISITVFATQYTHEYDSFNNTYDGAATFLNQDEAGNWLINNAGDLLYFAKSVNSGNAYKGDTIKLTADIDLGGRNWTPIGNSGASFAGIFDGQEHTVSNFKVDVAKNAGLFGVADGRGGNGAINNLTVKNATIKARDYAGAIIGSGYNHMDNCHAVDCEITVTPFLMDDGVTYDGGAKAGGIMGRMWEAGSWKIANCTVANVKITGYRDLGGLIGMTYGSNVVENCTVSDSKIAYIYLKDGQKYADNTPNGNMAEIVGRPNTATLTNNVANNVLLIKTFAATNEELDNAIKSGEKAIVLGSGTFSTPVSAKGKTLTFIGTGDTVIDVLDYGAAEGDCDYSLDGSTVTFENVTLITKTTYFPGYARTKGTYNNCTINGVWTLYDSSEFNNCTFNVSGDIYNVWTWGAAKATFNNCTFNNDGKAILVYGGGSTKLTVSGCTFNDNGGLTSKKAAIEVGAGYGSSFDLTINDTVVNGYEINNEGISTGTTLWANKNSMGTDKLNVVVDGVDVY